MVTKSNLLWPVVLSSVAAGVPNPMRCHWKLGLWQVIQTAALSFMLALWPRVLPLWQSLQALVVTVCLVSAKATFKAAILKSRIPPAARNFTPATVAAERLILTRLIAVNSGAASGIAVEKI